MLNGGCVLCGFERVVWSDISDVEMNVTLSQNYKYSTECTKIWN